MPEIQLPVAELKTALPELSKLLSRSHPLPILGAVRIERAGNNIILTTTDLHSSVSYRFPATDAGEPAVLVIPFAELSRIVKETASEEILTVSAANAEQVSIHRQSNSRESHCSSFPIEEWPVLPSPTQRITKLPDNAKVAVLEALQCAGNDPTRSVLQGCYLDVSQPNCHSIVATDGRHLYASNSFRLPIRQSVILPENRFITWPGFIKDGEWRLARVPVPGKKEAKKPEPMLQISSDRWTLLTHPLEGNYPNWRHVLPESTKYRSRALLGADAINQILHAVETMPCEDPANERIGLTLAHGKLSVIARAERQGKWREVPVSDAKVDGDDVTIQINRKFLAKALRLGLTKLEIQDSMSAMRFSRDGRQMIVMPLRPEAARFKAPINREPQRKPVQTSPESRPPQRLDHSRRILKAPTLPFVGMALVILGGIAAVLASFNRR